MDTHFFRRGSGHFLFVYEINPLEGLFPLLIADNVAPCADLVSILGQVTVVTLLFFAFLASEGPVGSRS